MNGVSRALSRAWIGVMGAALALAVAALFAPGIALLDLVRQVAPQTSLVALALAACALLARAHKAAVLGGAAAVAFALPAMPAAAGAAPTPTAERITVFFHNTHDGRANAGVVMDMIAAAKPDIVALVEAEPRRVRALEARLMQAFPYRATRDADQQIAIYSRWPLRMAPETDLPFSAAAVDVDTPFGTARVVATHLSRPWPFNYAALHRDQMALLGAYIAEHPQPTLVVGDFNAAPWSALGDRMSRAGLRAAGGLAGTWPARGAPLLRIAIDNGFAGYGLRALGKEVLGPTGSDHLPVVFTFERD